MRVRKQLDAWQRGHVLRERAHREQRLHKHRWVRLDDRIIGPEWRCVVPRCRKKRVTALQVLAAGYDEGLQLFMPIVDDQLDELLDSRSHYRRTGNPFP